MRSILRSFMIVFLLLGAWAGPAPRVSAANLDNIADNVLGQSNFTTNAGGGGPNGMSFPTAMALDLQGNLYAADYVNNRVLEYDAPFVAGAAANRVFGQAGSFITADPNKNGLSADSLSSPQGVVLDPYGNLYVADTGNNRVLEYDTPLATNTSADRVFGQLDFTHNTPPAAGEVSETRLNTPVGMSLDPWGNLYVADTSDNRVLEYDTPLIDASADKVFGQPDFLSSSANNGGLSATSMTSPYGVALDTKGNLFVAEYSNHRVLEFNTPVFHVATAGAAADRVFGQADFISNSGVVGIANRFSGPHGVALDPQDNLYVADTNNHRILEYDSPLSEASADRVFGQTNFTNHTPGVSSSGLDGPFGVALDAQGNLYVADTINNRVLEFDLPVPHGPPTLTALSPSTVAQGSRDFTLTVNGSGFVKGSVVRWAGADRPTTYLSTTQLSASISTADVSSPIIFAVTVFTPLPGGGTTGALSLPLYQRAGQDAIADTVLGQPNFTVYLGGNNLLPGWQNRLYAPHSVAFDPRTGRLFVSDSGNHRILSWPNLSGFANSQAADLVIGQPDFSTIAPNSGKPNPSAANLSLPQELTLDSQGNLYVADYGNHRILIYTAPLSIGMSASRVIGQGGSFTSALPNKGGISGATLNLPMCVTLDAQGSLYVADSNNNRVLEYDSPLASDAIAAANADRVFGQPNFTSATANRGGAVSASGLNEPRGVAVDAQGNLYVSDYWNSRVLEYNNPLVSGSAANRVFGQPDFVSNTHNNNGPGAASLSYPVGVAVDPLGDLYVADSANNRLLVYTSPLRTDTTADRVFGQDGSFTNISADVQADRLFFPQGMGLDPKGNLFVADGGSSRVLEYDSILLRLELPLVLR